MREEFPVRDDRIESWVVIGGFRQIRVNGHFARDALGILDYLNGLDGTCGTGHMNISVSCLLNKYVYLLDGCRFTSKANLHG